MNFTSGFTAQLHISKSMVDYKSLIPPPGTTITRPMTFAERRHAGRISFAKYAVDELIKMSNVLGNKRRIKAVSYGTIVFLEFKENGVCVEFMSRNSMFSPSPAFLPWHENARAGQATILSWLASQDPVFVARLLKNGKRQILDMKSLAGCHKNNFEKKLQYELY